MNFEHVVNTLYGRKASNVKIKLGLDRIEELCRQLDNPEKSFKIIHVAGTNGKGSVTKALSKIFIEQGYKVGTFISPHLVCITERIRINDNNITQKDFVDLYYEISPVVERMGVLDEGMEPSFFEIITAMAFKHYQKNNIDIAIVEVGLGGRLDSTNVVKPDVCIVNTVQKDHVKTLGNTLEEIAYEKAGIIKENAVVVVGDVNDSVFEVINKKAQISNASKILRFSNDFNYTHPKYSMNWNTIDYSGINLNLNELIFKSNGAYQPHNLTVALAAAESYAEKNSIKLNEESLRKAIKEFQWEGRFEMFEKDGKKIILEGAHNVDGIKMLEKTCNMYLPFSKKVALIGILDDKDGDEMIETIVNLFDRIIVAKIDTDRNENAYDLYMKMKMNFNKPIEFIESSVEGLEKLLKEKSDYYFVTGSLYLVGEIRGYLLKDNNKVLKC
jgi:dihydrofolate synthase/folylpolyglutamate synthase